MCKETPMADMGVFRFFRKRTVCWSKGTYRLSIIQDDCPSFLFQRFFFACTILIVLFMMKLINV